MCYLLIPISVGVAAILWMEFKAARESKKLGAEMSSGQQALADLTQAVNDLQATVKKATTEILNLLADLSQANNGLDPKSVEALAQAVRAQVTALDQAVSSAITQAPPVSVSVSPTGATLAVGGTQQFTASVTGAADTSVTWKDGSGSIDGNGLYTAPATPGTDTVVATSNADPTKSASASVTIS